MNVDIKGRVKNLNLPTSKGLLPVFEAVVNSIQAFSAVDANSRITVTIHRETSQQEIDDPRFIPEIRGFTITDNGSGFGDGNFLSFQTSDSTSKAEFGGKGIGRFLYLKAFDLVHVDSSFEQDGLLFSRSFDFVLSPDAIENVVLAPVKSGARQTSLQLNGFKKAYRSAVPKGTDMIAQRLLEHCLSFFLSGDVPQISVEDEAGERFNLNYIFQSQIRDQVEPIDFKVFGNPFTLFLIKYRTVSDQGHFISYCAHGREVRRDPLASHIPLLCVRLLEGSHEFVFLGYVIGKFLDEGVNQERTDFTFEYVPEEAPEQNALEFEGVMGLKHIRIELLKIVKAKAEPFLVKVREQHIDRIRAVVNTEAPEYKHILKFSAGELDKISPNTSEVNLEIELHKLSQKLELKIKEDSKRLLSATPKDATAIDEYGERYASLIDLVTDTGTANLTKYITHRKTILSLFEQRLKLGGDGKYSLEKAIHELFVPMRKDSFDVEFAKQNLWMIDERLSYHYYLSSDLPFSQIQPTDSSSTDRPDVMIFNKSIAYTETDYPYQTVVIIEFKRPERDGYTDDDNPITQVYSYMDEIEANKVKTYDGRTIQFRTGTPFYAYIVCDINDKIRRFAKDATFAKTPDEGGFFGFNQARNAYVEILSYDKLLVDAKKRNKVLFDKLGLPDNRAK